MAINRSYNRNRDKRARDRFIRSVVSRNSLVSGIILVLAACAESDHVPPDDLRLEHLVSSAPLPYSLNDGFAVLGPDAVCVFDSYETQVVCGDRRWTSVKRLGRKGHGPGELGPFGALVRGPDETAAFVDYVNGRVAFFTMHEYKDSWPLPERLTPAGDIETDSEMVAYAPPAPAGPPRLRMVRTDGRMGRVTHEKWLSVDSQFGGDGGTSVMSGVLRSSTGNLLVRLESGHEQLLAEYDSAGRFRRFLDLPAIEPQYPSDRDVDVYVEQLTRVFQLEPTREMIGTFRKQPLGRFPRGTLHGIAQFDEESRVWIVTTRRQSHGTLIDIFEDGDYSGSLLLAGRVLGIQIIGSLLVALAESPATGGSAVPPRRLDWYRITGK